VISFPEVRFSTAAAVNLAEAACQEDASEYKSGSH